MTFKKNTDSFLAVAMSGVFIIAAIVLFYSINAITLDVDEVEQCITKNKALSQKTIQREKLLDEIEKTTLQLEAYQKVWDERVGQLKDTDAIINKINRLGAELNIMLSENKKEASNRLSIELRGPFCAIMEWIGAVENEVLLVNFEDLEWSADRGDFVKCLVTLKVMNQGDTYDG